MSYSRLWVAVVMLCACDGRTVNSIPIAGDAAAVRGDATTKKADGALPDSMVSIPDGGPCSVVSACCPHLPADQQGNCRSLVSGGNEEFCTAYLQEIPEENLSCTGTGATGCELLALCCQQASGADNCLGILDAGNENACLSEFSKLTANEQCTGCDEGEGSCESSESSD
jgi:hypothetical protein